MDTGEEARNIYVEIRKVNGGYKVYNSAEEEGVDKARSKTGKRNISWKFDNQTGEDVTVEMRFAQTDFDSYFTSTDPAGLVDGNEKYMSGSVADGKKYLFKVSTVNRTIPIDLTYNLYIDGSVREKVDPGLRIDDGTLIRDIFVAVVGFALGLLAAYIIA